MDMSVRDFFRERYGIKGEEALDGLEAITEVIQMKRGDILLKQGEIAEKVFFQVDGIMRGFFWMKRAGTIRSAFHGSSTSRQCPAVILRRRLR